MKSFNRFLLFLYLVLFFTFVPVMFARADEVDTTSWLLNTSNSVDFRNDPLYAGGQVTAGNGQIISPNRALYAYATKGLTIYYDRSAQNQESLLYIVSPSPITGETFQTENYNAAAGQHGSFNPSNMNMTAYNANIGFIDDDFKTLFDFSDGDFYYGVFYCASIYGLANNASPIITDNNCNYIITSSQDLYNQVIDDNGGGGDGILDRYPYFYLKTYAPNGMLNKTEYTITWDLTGADIDPRNYSIQVYVCGPEDSFMYNFRNKKPIKSTDLYPIPLFSTAFAFTFTEVQNCFPWSSFPENEFYIYLRVVDSNNEPVNEQWINWHILRRIEITGSHSQIWSGDRKIDDTPIGQRTDGVFEYTDGRPTGDSSNGDGGTNSNGSQVSPDAAQNGLSNSNATNPELSGVDYGTSLADLSNNLSGLLSTLGNMPMILQTVLTFLPPWLVTLFSVSLGLIIVIGTAKLILR